MTADIDAYPGDTPADKLAAAAAQHKCALRPGGQALGEAAGEGGCGLLLVRRSCTVPRPSPPLAPLLLQGGGRGPLHLPLLHRGAPPAGAVLAGCLRRDAAPRASQLCSACLAVLVRPAAVSHAVLLRLRSRHPRPPHHPPQITRTLAGLGLTFPYFLTDMGPSGAALHDALKAATGQRTVP